MNDFERLYDDEYDKLYKYLILLCRNKDMAEDILQDTMLRAYEYTIVKGEKINSSWLFKVAKNNFLNIVKKEKRTFYDEEILDNQQCFSNNPQEKLEKQEISRNIVDTLDKLNKNYREIIIYRDHMNMSYDEIVQKTGLKLSQVKIRIFRARGAFKKEYNRRKENEM